MLTKNKYEDFSQYEIDLVRITSRRMVGKYGITQNDVPDLEQELMCHLWKKRRGYDKGHASGSSYETFISQVITKKSVDILKERARAKRVAEYSTALFSTLHDDIPGDMDNDDEYAPSAYAIWGIVMPDSCISPEKLVIAKIMLEEAINKMTDQQKKIFHLVESGYTPVEVAIRLNLSESTIYEHIEKICRNLRDAGFLDTNE